MIQIALIHYRLCTLATSGNVERAVNIEHMHKCIKEQKDSCQTSRPAQISTKNSKRHVLKSYVISIKLDVGNSGSKMPIEKRHSVKHSKRNQKPLQDNGLLRYKFDEENQNIYDWFNIFNQRIQKESVRPSKTSGKSEEIRIGKKAYNKAHGLKVWLSTSLVHLIVSRKLGKFVPVGYPEFLRLNTNS